MSKNKNLLNENTIRRMMKLASVDSLSDSFISTKYTPLTESTEEENIEEAKHEKDEEEKSVEESIESVESVETPLSEEEDEEMEMGMEADDEKMEMPDADEPAEEDEVTLTDDEARDIIALADKLRSAMGGEEDAAPEMEMDADEDDKEMEMDAEMEEEPGMRYDMMEEEEENLYEAALNNLDIDVVEDKEVQLENLKKEIYKKVVNRLLKESKK
jgi:hypothetical protein